ncbi:Transcriptional regulator, LysR family [Labilithrix luteola]|uniref:Transcriptional regulator, LysR family n=1 Tax=Labilithrix luteola TaxID=1391654 RepID=A0A0K1QA71_9BACT|nr:LysR family transcriptional regulator [Labilithrix luteola]AKV02639.1 Transcriptional regulator, LysR family [Labilithrix luteola]
MKRRVAEDATLVEDVSDLRAFCLVADLRSLTAAAKVLRESKATVSRRLSRLESSLGVRLLERSPRLVKATEDGLAYRARVGEVLELLGDANANARRDRAEPAGVLRVTSATEFNSVLAPLVVSFAEHHPKVRIEMLVTNAALDFDADKLDFAFRISFRLPDSALIAHKLVDLEASLVASPGYLRKRGVPKTPDALAGHPIIFMQTNREIVLPFKQVSTGRSTSYRVVPSALTTTDMNFVVELAAAGGGIGIVPSVAVERELSSRRLTRVLDDYALGGASLWLLHRGGSFLPSKVRAFRDFVLETFRARARRHSRPATETRG